MPNLPLPLLQLSKTVYTEKAYRTVKFTAVVAKEVDANIAIKWTELNEGVERLQNLLVSHTF